VRTGFYERTDWDVRGRWVEWRGKLTRSVRRVFVSLPLIIVVAFCGRGIYAWSQERQLPSNVRDWAPFFQETGNISQALAQGKGFSDLFRQGTGPTAFLTPVYPLILAGIFRVFGIFTFASFLVAEALNIVFSAVTCVPIFYAGRRIAGTGVGATASWMWAVYPNAMIVGYWWIWDTCLTTLLAALLFWFTLKLAETQRWRDWCLYGLLWGFALMTNPALASLLPFMLGWAIYRARPAPRRGMALVALAVLMAALCCTPWTVRNYVAFHRFVPLRSAFPLALWLAHNEVWDPHAPWYWRVTAYEQTHDYQRLGENSFMQQKWNAAVKFIRTHPALELRLFQSRFVAFWAGLPSPFESFAAAKSLSTRIVLAVNLFVALGTLAGLVMAWIRWRRYAFLMSTFPLVFPWIYYATQPYLRYRLPIDPVLLLLTALALRSLRGEPERGLKAGEATAV
jgi:hypothetical protein